MTASEVAAILGQCSRRTPTGIWNSALLTLLYRSGHRQRPGDSAGYHPLCREFSLTEGSARELTVVRERAAASNVRSWLGTWRW
jgi:hypothetical protein